MTHDSEIIITITAAMVAAAAAGHLVSLVRLPPIVGYLLAGMAIGPFTPLVTANTDIAGQLAELGIILLMFGVGIHFSVRSLGVVLRVALPAVLIHTGLITGVVMVIMIPTHWSTGSTIILGLSAAIASTVVVVRVLERRSETDTIHGRISVGWLVLEDLMTVFILVLLPALAPPNGEAVTTMDLVSSVGMTIVKASLLAAVMIFAGARVVPWLLRQAASRNSRELFLLTVLAIAFGIAYFSASIFDVSFALGAFLAGMVVSEADVSHQAAADALPFQDAFAVIFFVSVGMLVDPAYVLKAPLLVLAFVFVILVVRPLITWPMLDFLGLSTGPALTVAAARSQIGEFSFILGSLGMSLGLLPDDALNLILTGSIISIVAGPVMFKIADRIHEYVEHQPMRFRLLPSSKTLNIDTDALDETVKMRGHAVILGYGRVGSLIGEALQRRDFPYVAVERNQRIVDALREQGVPVVYGDGSHPEILRYLNLDRARLLIVALADPITTRLAVERAKELAPNLATVVRAQTEQERGDLQALGNVEPVIAERELAIEMTRFALRRFGLSSIELQALLRGLRFREAPNNEATVTRVTQPIERHVTE